jgi:hypothetical protein
MLLTAYLRRKKGKHVSTPRLKNLGVRESLLNGSLGH